MSVDNDEHGNFVGPITVNGWKGVPWPVLYNPPKLLELLLGKSTKRVRMEKSGASTALFADLPPSALNDLGETMDRLNIQESQSDNNQIDDTGSADSNVIAMEIDEDELNESLECEQVEIQTLNEDRLVLEKTNEVEQSSSVFAKTVQLLRQSGSNRKKPKWTKLESIKLQQLLSSDTKTLIANFTKDELLICARNCTHLVDEVSRHKIGTLTKLGLANAFSEQSGHPPTVITKRATPKKLRIILKRYFTQNVNKDTLNAITATHAFLSHDLPNWRDKGVFKDGISVGDVESSYCWYSQPEHYADIKRHVLFMLDCHHLFVNARCYVCQHGISGLGVKKEAWIDVANTKCEANTGLNIAMVQDLIDRQSNAIAQIVFSEKVENDMRTKGWVNEAEFCSTIRHWYQAEDERGIDVNTRLAYRMKMRKLLLQSVNIASFPPPGSHVAGMPIVMFEGILTNIDRRIQMYALVPGNAYNVRAPSSLDAANLFGEFQSLDPKGTGVLLADDVPKAMETASYLLQTLVDPERKFVMRTSATNRVYPAHNLNASPQDVVPTPTETTDVEHLDSIPIRNHRFDLPSTCRRKPKRKTTVVPGIDQPATGTRPVRQHHHLDSSKILPHVRMGIADI